MFFFLIQNGIGEWFQRTVTSRLSLEGRVQAKLPFIMSGLLPYPLSYAETPTGYVFFGNSFMPMMKWDGKSYQALTVGVARPTTAPTLAATGSGSLTGTYTAYARWVDKDGNPSNLSPISNTLTVTDVATFNYTDIPLTDDPKVTKLQLLRNTAGQASVYYVDVETTDLTGTSFSSTLSDTLLQAQEAVALFDEENHSIANRFGVPPNHKPFLVQFQNRLFAYGEIEYSEGSVEVTFGSRTVQGIGTSWVKSMEGRQLHVVGSPNVYQIESINVATQAITLTTAYTEATNLFAVYSIRIAPTERRLLYFSEASSFDAWPATNAIEIEENGDDGTGLAVAESFLFILQKRHIYRLTYSDNPLTDGGIFMNAERGCVNNRCWVRVENSLYMLDELGIHVVGAGSEPEGLSANVQSLFWTVDDDIGLRINWLKQRFFHAALFQTEMTIRWFVSLDGSQKPKHAICMNYASKAWWLESFPCEVGANCLMRPTNTRPSPMLAGKNSKAYSMAGGPLDMVTPAGDTRATATAATFLGLTSGSAVFQPSGLVGAPVRILDGAGKGQERTITSNTATSLSINQPWVVMPDTTSVFQIGGIPWLWRSAWSIWAEEDTSNVRRLVLVFEPCETDNVMNVRVFNDKLGTPITWGDARTAVAPEVVSVREDDPDLLVDLTNEQGYADIRMDSRSERYLKSRDSFTIEFEGVSGETGTRIHEAIIEGGTKGDQ